MAKTTFQRFSAALKQDYHHLGEEDECYYLGEYHPGEGFNGPGLNSAIQNLKKPMDRKGSPEWTYKNRAIGQFAGMISQTKLYQEELVQCVWVPVPPSAAKSDPRHDNRLVRILQHLRNHEESLIFHEILTSKVSRAPMHLSQGQRLTKDQIQGSWEVAKPEGLSDDRAIVIFDDVITHGTTYKAAKEMLAVAYPQSRIIGVFLARTKRHAEDYLLNIDQSDFGWTFGVQDEDGN